MKVSTISNQYGLVFKYYDKIKKQIIKINYVQKLFQTHVH